MSARSKHEWMNGVEPKVQKEPKIIEDDVVVAMAYTLKINGEEVDASSDDDPLLFIQGQHNIITGLENQIYGLKIGDRKQVTVSPAEGYGDIDPEAIVDLPRTEFPAEIPLEIGVELDITDEDGELMTAEIVEVHKETVRLDFNHPFAGETLNFDIQILDLRTPTQEELDHGHVHGEELDHHHNDD